MDHFSPNAVLLPACPSSLTEKLNYPSVCMVNAVLGFCSLILAIWTGTKYNSVVVYNWRPQRKPAISNTWWVLYYISITLRCLVDAVKYGIINSLNYPQELALIILSLFMNGVCTLFISFALYHQKKYRSTFGYTNPEKPGSSLFTSSYESSSSPAINISSKDDIESLKEKLYSLNTIFVILFVVYGGSLYGLFGTPPEQESTYFTFFLVVFSIQRLPVLILAIIIVFHFPERKIEGPKNISRFIMLIASILDTINNIPVTLWAEALHDNTCLFHLFGKVDLIHVIFVLAQILFFIFLRSEFIRNKEQFEYNTVQTKKEYQQYGIDWRHFNDAPRNDT